MNEINIAFSEFDFSYARSSGPGGQSVNTANSKVILHWNIDQTTSLSPSIITRFKEKYPHLINDQGQVYITSQLHRSQKKNMDDCIEKLYQLLKTVQFPEKTRKKTKPKKSAVRKRLDSKRLHSLKKQNRSYKE
ncbi:MAG TPA: alternative ribosome rescue aminoacyl-tRNA hydrolase ArfB [Bacteriovoracaceae bacterium]|nr:alternative ribosome rescue aminoacyl-tRNA hydrolase ArfB [Bacteriovoracaceae bacterium]